ncbi:MAG TPA: hypothetical protein VG900_12615 [Hyphomicrobiaceae bacterium]|nr:hypothetical protein [Hyphomicrobiaceae bacterium]
MNYTTHLFSYRFQGKTYTVDIVAKDEAEAKDRLKALAWAEYDGELVARMPAELGSMARLFVAARNIAHGIFH